MKSIRLLTYLTLLLSLTGVASLVHASSDDPMNVAKVIILRGKAKAKSPNAEPLTLKKGDWVKEGAVIQTSSKSFVKLLFIDKSQMNLGPKSKMVINKFPRKKAGIITLMKGSLRSKVTKDYLDIKDKDKSKLFIKTKSAAMGVRGTDFEVKHNPSSGITNLDVISGLVVMAKVGEGIKIDQESLEKAVSSDNAVSVGKGTKSSVSPKSNGAAEPTKIPKEKLQQLRKTSSSEFTATRHVPPGMSQKIVKNETAGQPSVNSEASPARAPASESGAVANKPGRFEPANGGPAGGPHRGPNHAALDDPFDADSADQPEQDGPDLDDPIAALPDLPEIEVEVPDPCGLGQCDPSRTNVRFDFNVE